MTDSAACLLVVGGYREYARTLSDVVEATKEEILGSPALGDFFAVRWVDMGPRPPQPSDVAAGVARLILELTSRPDEAARNFSALMVIDRSASVVDLVLRACRADRVLSDLRVRIRGLASIEDRSAGTGGGTGPEIAIAPGGSWGPDALVKEVVAYTNRLLSDFGSGLEQGFPAEGLDQLGARAELEHRGTVQAAAQVEAAARKRKAERPRKAERQAESQQEVVFRREAADPVWTAEPAGGPAWFTEAEHSQAAAADHEAADAAPQPDAERSGELLPADDGWQPRARVPGSPAEPVEPVTDRAMGSSAAHEASQSPQAEDSALRRLAPRARGRSASRGRGGTNADAGVNILLECLELMEAGDTRNFTGYLAALRGYAGNKLSSEDRQRFRDITDERRLWLFLPCQPPGELAAEFYSVLLRIVYGLPLDYPAYCEIEDFGAAFDKPVPQPALLAAMNVVQPADVRVTAITHYHLGAEWLTGWFRSGKADIGQLIAALAGEWDRLQHAEILDFVTFQYLTGPHAPKPPRAVRTALREHGNLAAALQERYPDRRGNQVALLAALLRAASPAGLDRRAVEEIFNVSAPTRALAAAVLQALADPADRIWAAREFMARMYAGEEISARQEAEIVEALISAPMVPGPRAT